MRAGAGLVTVASPKSCQPTIAAHAAEYMTEALDETNEARLYALMRERLPGTMMFSVGHRGTLGAFHARRLVVQPRADGTAAIVEAPAPPVSPERAEARRSRH